MKKFNIGNSLCHTLIKMLINLNHLQRFLKTSKGLILVWSGAVVDTIIGKAADMTVGQKTTFVVVRGRWTRTDNHNIERIMT